MKNLSIFHIPLAAIVLLLIFQSCAAPPDPKYMKDGKQYGTVRGSFRNRWWNFYERGLSFMEGQFYEEAISDFDHAISKRPADKRRARTYGMHFVDYFPHRELGLTYYLLGKYDSAKKELELSLEQQPSAKAQFYLDKVRKMLIEREGQAASSPHIMVDLVSDEIWTKDDPVIVSGTAEDNRYISKLVVAGKPVFLQAAAQRIPFKEELELGQGEHRINISAENLLGGRTERSLTIHVDRQGPVISVEPLSSNSPTQNGIRGYLYDESGKISLTMDGVPIPVPEGEDVSFAAPIIPESSAVILLAKDKLGNETRAEIALKSLSTRKRYPLLASNGFANIMSDSGAYTLAFSFGKKDTQAPVVKLRGWLDDQTVFLARAYIEGEVRDENDIAGLTINDSPVLRRESKIIFFNHLVELKEGKNLINIRAEDKKGNTTEKTISITRQVPKVFQLGSRFSVTLVPFEDKSLTPGLREMYNNLFLAKLVDQNRFRIIEREKLDRVMQELKLSNTDLVDKGTALKLGRLVAAQSTIFGSFLETRNGIEIVSRLVDNETSEILAEKDVYGELKDRSSLMLLAEGMALKYNQEFPLVEGLIVQEKGDSFFTDLGEGKTKPQRRLIIYREGEEVRHPVTGKLLGRDTEILGYARVTQVLGDMSRAEPVKVLTEKDIRIMDKVMTQ